MASGMSVQGGVSRCYEAWTAYVHCAVDSGLSAGCLAIRDDYLECLHHKKYAARQQLILAEKKRLERERKPVVRPAEPNEQQQK